MPDINLRVSLDKSATSVRYEVEFAHGAHVCASHLSTFLLSPSLGGRPGR